jgi:hypothetical protein
MTESFRDLIRRLKEEEKAATEGPWARGTYNLWAGDICLFHGIASAAGPREQVQANADLIVDCRNSLPRLLALAEAAMDHLDAFDAACAECRKGTEYSAELWDKLKLAREKVRAIVEGSNQ